MGLPKQEQKQTVGLLLQKICLFREMKRGISEWRSGFCVFFVCGKEETRS